MEGLPIFIIILKNNTYMISKIINLITNFQKFASTSFLAVEKALFGRSMATGYQKKA